MQSLGQRCEGHADVALSTGRNSCAAGVRLVEGLYPAAVDRNLRDRDARGSSVGRRNHQGRAGGVYRLRVREVQHGVGIHDDIAANREAEIERGVRSQRRCERNGACVRIRSHGRRNFTHHNVISSARHRSKIHVGGLNPSPGGRRIVIAGDRSRRRRRAGEHVHARIIAAARSVGRIVLADRGRELVPNAAKNICTRWPGSRAGSAGVSLGGILGSGITLRSYLASRVAAG